MQITQLSTDCVIVAFMRMQLTNHTTHKTTALYNKSNYIINLIKEKIEEARPGLYIMNKRPNNL